MEDDLKILKIEIYQQLLVSSSSELKSKLEEPTLIIHQCQTEDYLLWRTTLNRIKKEDDLKIKH